MSGRSGWTHLVVLAGQLVFLVVYRSVRSMRCATAGSGLAIILTIRCGPEMARMPTMTAGLTPRHAQDVLVGTGHQTFIRGLWVRVRGWGSGRVTELDLRIDRIREVKVVAKHCPLGHRVGPVSAHGCEGDDV
jgi:hypothetical protein